MSTKPFEGLNRKETQLLQAEVLSQLIPELHKKHDDDRTYRYDEPTTKRSFRVTKSSGYTDSATGQLEERFFLFEYVPTGMMCLGSGAKERWVKEPLIHSLEEEHGPNGLHAALESNNIDPAGLAWAGGGYSVDTRYLSSMDACAKEISKALKANKRYNCYRTLTAQEKLKNIRREEESRAEYFRHENTLVERAQNERGIFKGCYSKMGLLEPATKERILTYLNRPSQTLWLAIRGLEVAGLYTLWQAWTKSDPDAPRSGNTGFPGSEELREAIRHITEFRAVEVKKRYQECTKSGLSLVA